MSNYSEHTIIRYNQINNTIKSLYEQHIDNNYVFPESLINNCDKIIELLCKTYELTTVITCISGILWNLGSLYDNNKYTQETITSIQDKYKHHRDTIKEKIEKDTKGKEFNLTAKEEKTFLYWEQIINVHQQMLEKLDKTRYDSFLDFVIISLYVIHPPTRADYANMRVFIDDSLIPDNFSDNYCVLQTNPRFVFNKYKTSKYKGTKIIHIDSVLHEILIDWMNINKSDYILSTYNKKTDIYTPLNENNLSHKIRYIFNKYTQKPASINTLRHSFISFMSKYDQNNIIKQKNADKMMHSTNMAEQYRRFVY
jgi:hypothetical protein